MIKRARYKKILCLTPNLQPDDENVIFGELKMESLGDKPTFSSPNSILRFLKNTTGLVDCIEAGDIKFNNIDTVKSVVEECSLLCELELSPTFFKIPYRFARFWSVDRKVHYLATLLGKRIDYYVCNKKAICYIHKN